MQFDYTGFIMNPFILMFLAVITGILFGKIKFGKFNFGISGALFTGLAIGWGVYRYGQKAMGPGYSEKIHQTAFKFLQTGVIDKSFFTLFLILFVVSVGLLAAKDINVVIKKYGLKFILMGFFITFFGAAATYAMTIFAEDSNPYEVSGVYTGALTSSPGLAAAIETAREHASNETEKIKALADKNKAEMEKALPNLTSQKSKKNTKPEDEMMIKLRTEIAKKEYVKNAEASIGVGHAIGYPFGVLIVIFAVNFFPKLFRIDIDKEKELYHKEMAEAKAANTKAEIPETDFDLLAFITACLFGYFIGMININLKFIGLGYFSLGSTGGALIGALALGYFGKLGILNFRMNSKILGIIRQIALAFFLAIVGLRYGFKVIDALMGSGAYLALVALVVGIVAMMTGFIIGRYIFKINWIMLSGAICGGMTSTPGLGAAVDAIGSDDPAAGYGATYPSALLGMVIFTIILHNLPM